MNDTDTRVIAWLLLRDGHAVPLRGLDPDDIKASAKATVPYPETEFRHRQRLNAIVDRLGFGGDFGTYKREHWPRVQAFFRDHDCQARVNLFPNTQWAGFRLWFGGSMGPKRRQLADRVFLADLPKPNRVFLGWGVDWLPWAERVESSWEPMRMLGAGDKDFVTADRESAIQFVLPRRIELSGQWGFLDDKLVGGPVESVVDKTCWTEPFSEPERQQHASGLLALVRAFRVIFDEQEEGWVDVIPYPHNDRLVFLRAHDGSWDLLWRDLREEAPPQAEGNAKGFGLHEQDLPMGLSSRNDLARQIYFRRDVWAEREEHAAEQHFYDRGGQALDRRMTPSDECLRLYLADTGQLPDPEKVTWEGPLPGGFLEIEAGGGRLLVSELVTVAEFRRMLEETGYLERRDDGNEPWERANEGQPGDVPVGASWRDAQAFLAWKERQLGVALRLPSKEELRSLRPFHSDRYARMAGADFLWENWPPRPIIEQGSSGTELRRDLPSAIIWSEARFLEPGPDLPEFPAASGLGQAPRKAWIADFPPRAHWRSPLPWAEHAGLQFIDAWDAYEWSHETGWVSGRFWEGLIGASSWGAYKNVKIGFRIVIDLA